ncbi:MAG: hypothetical protein KDB80_16470, partial [Planctomycetes bacterium]|nr:hypothetical protein [Planctomycetota bacterium]
LQLILRNSAGRSDEPPKFLGVWHDDDVQVTFEPDGTLDILGARLAWFVERECLMLRDANGWVLPIDWSVEDGHLVLPESAWWPAFDLAPGPMPAPDAASIDELAIATHLAAGRRDLALPHLESLRSRFATSPDARIGASLAKSLHAYGEIDAAIAIACETITHTPPAPRSVHLLHGHARTDPSVRAVLRRAYEASHPGTAWRTTLARSIVRAIHRESPAEAADLLCRSVLEAGENETTIRWLQVHNLRFPDDILREAVLRCVDLPHHELLERVAAIATTDRSPAATVLGQHLRRIDDLCRTAGASLVLLAYPGGPFAKPEIAPVVDRVAEERDIPVIRPGRMFPELSQESERGFLYAPDGHCTDAGYARIADAVAEHVIEFAERHRRWR